MTNNPSASRDRLVSIGLIFVIVLIVSALVISIYQMLSSDTENTGDLFNNPRVISIAIGFIVSILFIDRWRSLESKIDNLSRDQREKLNDIERFTNEQTELKIGQAISKADSLNAKLASIAERHPWLEVITERDIIVETDSVRGILRTSYMLLKTEKWLHLHEYLEYCARKGTNLDTREKKIPLVGTADDFFELSKFCEIWLEDFALSSEFIKRYIETSSSSPYALMPLHVKQLLRIGNIHEAKHQSSKLRKIVYGNNIYSAILRMLGLKELTSLRYKWEATNVLSVAYRTFGENILSERFHKHAQSNMYSKLFSLQQRLSNIDLNIEKGDFEQAKQDISDISTDEISTYDISELIYLLSKIGDYEGAGALRSRLIELRSTTYGDDSSFSGVTNDFVEEIDEQKKEDLENEMSKNREQDIDNRERHQANKNKKDAESDLNKGMSI